MEKQNWLADNVKPIGFLIILLGAIGYLFMVTLISTDVSIRSQALIAMISLATGAAGYYYGYSQGAAKKDDIIASAKPNPTVVQTGDQPTVNTNDKQQ